MTHERPQGLRRRGTSEAGCLVEAPRYKYYGYSAAGPTTR
jgi:hypothetical protein